MSRTALPLMVLVLFSMFAVLPLVSASSNEIELKVVVHYAIPPTDDADTNPHYKLLRYRSYSTIKYYINPTNSYGFSSTSVVNTVTTASNAWDAQTSYAVFNYQSTTTRTAGEYDGFNVVSWGSYQGGIIAVTFSWVTKAKQVVEVDCLMNTYYDWSLSGEAGKMDVQNIMTHEFGHFCGLADLYKGVDYWLTMYGYSNYAITYQRTLGLGDINGLRAVYGS